MAIVTPFPNAVQSPPARRFVRTLQGSVDARRIADAIKDVDTVLDRPDPRLPRPTIYRELADEAIGRLDPTIVGPAEHAGARELQQALLRLDRAHSPEEIRLAILAAFRLGLHAYHDVLSGRRQFHAEGATGAQHDGR